MLHGNRFYRCVCGFCGVRTVAYLTVPVHCRCGRASESCTVCIKISLDLQQLFLKTPLTIRTLTSLSQWGAEVWFKCLISPPLRRTGVWTSALDVRGITVAALRRVFSSVSWAAAWLSWRAAVIGKRVSTDPVQWAGRISGGGSQSRLLMLDHELCSHDRLNT